MSNQVDAGQGQNIKSLGDNFIEKHIKRTNRNLLITNVGSILFIIWLWRANCFDGFGYWALVICGVIILNIWNIIKVWKRSKDITSHHINICLARLGSPQKISSIINEEVKKPKVLLNSIIITESWLIRPTFYGLELSLLAELAWIHTKVTSNYTNGVYTGKSYSVIIYKRDGKSFEMACDESISSLLMARVAENAPWVVGGFSEEIQRLWNTDRNAFIAYIDQRKREINLRKKNL
jgi:hypothetical protein